MTEQIEEAIQTLEAMKNQFLPPTRNVLDMAIKALEKQKELYKNCEGSCIDCKYRGEFRCANDLLID